MSDRVLLPDLPYRPPTPADPPNIALVGCGGITSTHLDAYTEAGWEVVAFCDIDVDVARERRDEYYPDADVTTDAAEVFDRDDVGVVDIATKPGPRPPIIEDAIRAGKHVLSQKPFVLDLDQGDRLVELAAENGVRLAVNQNGRWAPHWSWIRNAVREGLIGDLLSVHFDTPWDHDDNVASNFDDVRHAILYDYAIHHFDMLACLLPDRRPERVSASVSHTPIQRATPPLLGQVIVEYGDAQASLVFDGNVRHGGQRRTYVAGSDGTLRGERSPPDQTVTLYADGGTISPNLEGSWAPTGFRGTMAELLAAIEEDREPENSARNNLRSLELCYAAVAAADRGGPTVPGEVRTLRNARGSDE